VLLTMRRHICATLACRRTTREWLQFLGAGFLCVLAVGLGFSPAVFAQMQQIPAFELEKLDGTRFSSKSLNGQVVLVDFWATWCKPCLEEIPHWNELHERYREKGLVVLGITIQSGWASDIKPDVEKLKIKYPLVIGDQKVEKGFGGIWGFPTTFLIDRKGRIYKKYTGQQPQKHAQIEADIQKLLAEKP